MADDRLTIDPATVFDNIDDRCVEFTADIDGERQDFTVQYDVLRALSTEEPEDRAVTLFHHHADRIADLGTIALARNGDQTRVVISENDLS